MPVFHPHFGELVAAVIPKVLTPSLSASTPSPTDNVNNSGRCLAIWGQSLDELRQNLKQVPKLCLGEPKAED